jgi:hypothetical protein
MWWRMMLAGRWRRPREGECSLAEEGLQAPIRVIEALKLQIVADESPRKESGVGSEVG